jgi:hypothetical protein
MNIAKHSLQRKEIKLETKSKEFFCKGKLFTSYKVINLSMLSRLETSFFFVLVSEKKE